MSCTTMSVFTEECGVSYIDTNATVAGIEVLRYKGTYASFEELINTHPIAEPGDYAAVVEPDRVLLYIWVEDSWTLPINKLMSPEEVKTLYEENENTNAFTDDNLDKLDSIEAGAQVNTVTSVAGKVGGVTLNKVDVGLNNVDNTADLNKPISTAAQSALDGKVDKATGQTLMTDAERLKLSGIEAGAQVNSVTSVSGRVGAVTLDKTDVGLSDVDNTSDLSKPISSATQSALDGKVDKVSGQSLMTSAEKAKLSGIEIGAQVNVGTNISQGTRTATTLPLVSSTGTGTTLPISTTTLAGLQSATDKTKLDGIAVGATANSTDAQLRDRSTHTGTQAISTINGLQGELDAITLAIGDISTTLDAINGEVI